MNDRYEVVIVDRKTGKSHQTHPGTWSAVEADRWRSTLESFVDPARFDVCVQLMHQAPPVARCGQCQLEIGD